MIWGILGIFLEPHVTHSVAVSCMPGRRQSSANLESASPLSPLHAFLCLHQLLVQEALLAMVLPNHFTFEFLKEQPIVHLRGARHFSKICYVRLAWDSLQCDDGSVQASL